jgi:hypothetical protein
MKMCKDFTLNFGNKRIGCCIMTMHCLTLHLHRGIFDKNNMTVVPHTPYSPDLVPCNFSLFPCLKIKLKGRCFDTIEVIETELQAVLNTLIEHNLQDAFKKMAEVLGIVHMCGRGHSRVMVASRPKVSF